MRAAYPVAAVRAAETALMAALPPGTLMARAAAGLAATCAGLLRRTYGSRVVLLVGSGDNGGDALLAGALLARRGARVDAVLLGDRANDGALAAVSAAGGRVHAIPGGGDAHGIGELIGRADLVVDGVLGIGGRGALRGPAADLAAASAVGPGWRVAVDLPSGVDADSGDVPGAAFRADVTVTFGCLKPGLLVAPGARMAGVVELVDIGLGPFLRGGAADSEVGVATPAAPMLAAEVADVHSWWPYPTAGDDKYSRGVVGVAAGSGDYPGAAVLCVGGALGAGAGMVRFDPGGDQALAARVQAAWPEAVTSSGRVQAWVVGPGLGTSGQAADRLSAVLSADVPVLVDADGLTVLAANPAWVRSRTALTVLTPHDREYERFGRPIGSDRVGAARALAADLGVCVLLKGSTTVVASPGGDGAVYVNSTGTPWLATAGSGDVLSGITGALLAAGLGALAPVAGAFVHGLAGALAADGAAATAAQVAGAVPAAVRSLAKGRDRIGG